MVNALSLVNETVGQIRSLVGFTPGELSLLLDIYNGTGLTPEVLDRDALYLEVEGAFRLYPDVHHRTWGVDRKALLGKIRKLTDVQAVCLQLWACDFWSSGIHELPDAINRYVLGKLTISSRLAEALHTLHRAADLQEKSKGAFKSKLITEAKAETEKALDIIMSLLA